MKPHKQATSASFIAAHNELINYSRKTWYRHNDAVIFCGVMFSLIWSLLVRSWEISNRICDDEILHKDWQTSKLFRSDSNFYRELTLFFQLGVWFFRVSVYSAWKLLRLPWKLRRPRGVFLTLLWVKSSSSNLSFNKLIVIFPESILPKSLYNINQGELLNKQGTKKTARRGRNLRPNI